MTADETAAILALFASAWPNAKLAERTPDVWADACRDVDPDAGLCAARALVRSDEFFPSVARFLATVQAQRKWEERPSLPEDTGRRLTTAENLERVRWLRGWLRERAAADRQVLG